MKLKLTTSRRDMDSYTQNPETGEIEHVVYIYFDDGRTRAPIFAGKNNNARSVAELLAAAPKLLASCEASLERFVRMEGIATQTREWGLQAMAQEAIKELRVVIAKAEGKEQG